MIVDMFTGEVIYNPGTGLDDETMDRLRDHSRDLGSVLNNLLNDGPETDLQRHDSMDDMVYPMLLAKVEVDKVIAKLEVMLGTDFGRDQITVQFRRAGTICYLSAYGEYDCPACGRIHTENELFTMKYGDTALNWCPCGCMWTEDEYDFEILTTGPRAKRDHSAGFDWKQSYMDNNVRYMLRTTETHIGGVDSHGDLWELFYLKEDGEWVVDSPSGPWHYSQFGTAWHIYWSGRNA